MQAMLLEGQSAIEGSPLRLVELPRPLPGVGEVLVRVKACAVCRTDLHVIEGDLPPRLLPLIPGHQLVGVVESLGEGCRLLGVGERVGVAWLRRTCGDCEYCRGGQENLCGASRYSGYTDHGGFAEYAVVPEEFAYRLPAGFGDVQAAPLLCAGIIGYRALSRCGVKPGGSLALFGFGASAHLVIQLALHRGCRVLVVTRGEGRQRLARELGAEWAGADASQAPGEVDGAIIFAPAGELVPPALSMLKRGGTLALAGVYMSPTPPLDYERHLFYERDIHPVTANTRADGRALLAEAARASIQTTTHPYPLAQANKALQDLKAGRLEGAAVLVIAQ